MDPVDEFFSGYVFVRNNPIRLNDPDGAGGEDQVKTVSFGIPPPTPTAVDATDPTRYDFDVSIDPKTSRFIDNTIRLLSGVGGTQAAGRQAFTHLVTKSNPVMALVSTALLVHFTGEVSTSVENYGRIGPGLPTEDRSLYTVMAGNNEALKDMSQLFNLSSNAYKYSVLRPFSSQASIIDRTTSAATTISIFQTAPKFFDSSGRTSSPQSEIGFSYARVDQTKTTFEFYPGIRPFKK